ncbi:MAG TPA: CoA pyrophosphatase [Spirochaetota bacterium]|nr:CoA pyrophosphatase [Spirochaetota bacterium]
MKMRFQNEDDFACFREELRQRLSLHAPRTIQKKGLRQAAVIILIMNRGGEAHVLLTKRTEKVGTHKGQMALPGGGYDENDGDFLSTALRETEEEVGVRSADIDVLGRFDDFISIVGFHVVSYIGVIPHPYEYTINCDEIEEYVEVPLAMFVNREYGKVQQVEFEGSMYNVYYYYYQNFEIWGMTSRILTDFAAKILNICPGEKVDLIH